MIDLAFLGRVPIDHHALSRPITNDDHEHPNL